MSFEGFPDEAFRFYEGLCADNTKAYWTDHRSIYDTCVKAPMEALIAQLETEFGAATFFRPYRDVRFAKDKSPYKDHAAAVVKDDASGKSALYVQVGSEGIYVGGGYFPTATDQARRLRAAIATDSTGRALMTVLEVLTADGFDTCGETLKRLPKEYDPSHPRAALLRHKSLVAGMRSEPAGGMSTPECSERIASMWRALLPLGHWLQTNVGATTSPMSPYRGRP
ncbi:MAG: DUF2461 domain-containing protein [Mycobacteriales bacterium]